MRYVLTILLFTLIFARALTLNAELTPEGHRQLEKDWLFQCDNEPTLEKAKKEIDYARQLAAVISEMDGAPNLDIQLAALEELEKKIAESDTKPETGRELYFAVRYVKREIVFSNPLLTFDKILLIDNPYPKGKPEDITDEWGHEARHRNGFMAESGGRLLIVGLNPGGEVTDVLEGHEGSFWRPDLSFDAKKILFCFEPKGERSFHLYECNVDGSDLKQLTWGDYDDLDPIYTPDDKILFCTTRQHSYVRCMPMTHSFAVARCDADGKNIYVISANGEPDYLPSMMNDGRVIFTRWEYTEKALWRVQSLWTMNPDGTNPQTFWGNQSVWPDVLTEARAIPNSNKIMFTGVGHHSWFSGSIGTVDPSVGLNYPDGLERITREVSWAEVGDGPREPKAMVEYHASGKFTAYKTPYPLSEEFFLVSAREGWGLYNGSDNGWLFDLYFMDIYGNKELIYTGKYNAYHAIPFASRPVPPIKPDTVKWPEIDSDEPTAPGILYSNNVFEGAPEILKENGKAIRIVQMDPKTYTTWHKTVQHDGPAISAFQADGVKRVLGTVPIEEDGSIHFEVPAGQAIFFEMLDKDGQAIHVMRSFTSVMPGERRGCTGCHESNLATQQNISLDGAQVGIAVRKPAIAPVPPPWGAEESVGFKRFVQDPVLDKYCAKCHQDPENEACKTLNMTWRPSSYGWWNWVYHRPNDISPFMEPYLTLVGGPLHWGWGEARERNEFNVPISLAGVMLVEGFTMNDPSSLKTLPPYSAYSAVSKLVHNAASGEHHGVKVEGEDLARLIAWVDCNGPFLGDEEIREMYDPNTPTVNTIPLIQPRIGTAPKIDRFHIRQDGDTKVLLGEPRFQPNPDPNFDPNAAVVEMRCETYQKNLPQYQKEHDEGLCVEIESAWYGAGEPGAKTCIDVTDIVREHCNGLRCIDIFDYKKYFGNPAPVNTKTLRISYRINGGDVQLMLFHENWDIVLEK